MKSLALSIACAVGFAAPAFSGDLGSADIASRNDLPLEYSFTANCYSTLDRAEGPECSANFVNGKLSVDGSTGIFPHQASSITEKYYMGAYYVTLQYETSVGNTSIAQFAFNHKTTAKQFVNTLVLFMGDNLPVNASQVVDKPIMEEVEIEESTPSVIPTECDGPSILCF